MKKIVRVVECFKNKAGADANAWREQRYGSPVTPIEVAINRGDHRLWSILFRGGATIPTDDDYAADVLEDYTRHRAHPYLRKIETAGGWKALRKSAPHKTPRDLRAEIHAPRSERARAADRRVLVPRRLLLEVASKFYYGLRSSEG